MSFEEEHGLGDKHKTKAKSKALESKKGKVFFGNKPTKSDIKRELEDKEEDKKRK